MSMATRTDMQSPALHVGDSHDLIRVQGARENNLKDVSVEIPKRRLTISAVRDGVGQAAASREGSSLPQPGRVAAQRETRQR